MFQKDLWIADPNNGILYQVENDAVKKSIVTLPYASAVHVGQDMSSVYTAHKTSNYVVKYRDGERVLDIKVGEDPMAMCEDSKGNIYVANYTSSTVSKISNGRVVKTISVSKGPRDIVADSRDTIYVCSYLGNVIDIISNDILVQSVPVKYGPRAIICDVFDNIWVACYTSNTLCKLNNAKSQEIDLVADLTNQIRGPIALASTKKGTIYVAGYLGNSVGVINSGELSTIIGVPYGPTAIVVNDNDEIYVNSESGGTVTKIVSNRVVSSFTVCPNPICFGDCTGAATYNIYNYTQDSEGASQLAPTGGWSFSDLDIEVRTLLNQVKSGNMRSDASLISYENNDYTSVQAALDKLLNVAPVINSFKLAKDMYEFGQTVSALSFTWSFNKPMSQATIQIGNTVIADLRGNSPDPIEINGTITVEDLAVTETTSIVLKVQDDEGLIDSASVKVRFEHRFLYGAIDEQDQNITQVQLNTLKKSPVMISPYGKYFRVNCGDDYDKTPIICTPISWGIDESKICLVNGYSNDWELSEVTYTNAVGGSSTYQVFRFGSSVVGELLFTIVEVI